MTEWPVIGGQWSLEKTYLRFVNWHYDKRQTKSLMRNLKFQMPNLK